MRTKFAKPSTPSTLYACRPAEAKRVGILIPGRRGGVIAGCATPALEHPREGQWWIGLPVVGFPIRKSTAARRIRDQFKVRRADDPSEVERASQYALEGDRDHIPYPTGLEFPHIVGSSRCDLEHPLWRRYPGRLADARESGDERAAMEIDPDASREEYSQARERFAAEDFARDPQFREWLEAETKCAQGFQSREAARKGKAEFSQGRETAQRRQRAKLERVDLSSAEWKDTLRAAEAKPRTKRPRQARSIASMVAEAMGEAKPKRSRKRKR